MKLNFLTGCHTPDFLEGECKPIKECSVLYSMLDDLTEQKVTFLRKSRCGGGSDNTNPRVCCPKEPNLRQSAVGKWNLNLRSEAP